MASLPTATHTPYNPTILAISLFSLYHSFSLYSASSFSIFSGLYQMPLAVLFLISIITPYNLPYHGKVMSSFHTGRTWLFNLKICHFKFYVHLICDLVSKSKEKITQIILIIFTPTISWVNRNGITMLQLRKSTDSSLLVLLYDSFVSTPHLLLDVPGFYWFCSLNIEPIALRLLLFSNILICIDLWKDFYCFLGRMHLLSKFFKVIKVIYDNFVIMLNFNNYYG